MPSLLLGRREILGGDVWQETRLHFKSEGCPAQAPIRSEMRNQPVSPTARRELATCNRQTERRTRGRDRNARRLYAEYTLDGRPRLLEAAAFDLLNSHSLIHGGR